MIDLVAIAKKWYDVLNFPKEYDPMFEKILKREDISEKLLEKTTAELRETGDFELSLIYALLKCEDLEKKYEEKGISRKIFTDTIEDIKIWTIDCYDRTSVFGLEHIWWLSFHLELRLFKLGRLQFNFTKALANCEEEGLKEGDNTVSVHITRDEPFTPEKWEESFHIAGKFFKEYFPEYNYRFYTLSSWFLSPDLKFLMKPDSNILKFQKLFKIIKVDESDLMLGFIFKWGTKIENIDEVEIKTSLHQNVKDYIKAGNKLHNGYGIMRKDYF